MDLMDSEKQKKWKRTHMEVAFSYASLSTAERAKVGCIFVKRNESREQASERVIAIGINGMPSGWDNSCEYEENGILLSKPEVLHAEANCIAKIAQSNESSYGASAFITHEPCLPCAKQMYQCGIKEVYFRIPWPSLKGLGIEFLKKSNIIIERI